MASDGKTSPSLATLGQPARPSGPRTMLIDHPAQSAISVLPCRRRGTRTSVRRRVDAFECAAGIPHFQGKGAQMTTMVQECDFGEIPREDTIIPDIG